MKSTKKAEQLSQDIYEHLKLRLDGAESTLDTVRQDRDANGWPLLMLSVAGDESHGHEVVAIRIQSFDAVSKDVFGGDLIAFNPQRMQIYYQSGQAPTSQDMALIMYECARRADRLEQWVTQTGSHNVQTQLDDPASVMEAAIEEFRPSN